MKKILTLLTCVAIAFVFVGCSSKGEVKEIKPSSISERMDNKETFVVEFASTTCSHCIAFAPIYEGYAKENTDIPFYRIYIDKVTDDYESDILNDLANKYTIGGTPTTLFFKDGVYKGQIVGTVTKEELASKTQQYLK
ncbi:MAG: thioredoxin family protein [Bacilli bacterium]|jgi:thiol-disulfide isomerase/thioredoxin|nr:thioredoxin family protein [Bacilli bacterium]